MGCWNKTCALSNLPIFAGDDVYVFVLTESSDYSRSNPVYPSYLYSPVLLPFESSYNDYGGGELSRGVAFPLIMAAIKENLIEKDLGENSYREIEIGREGFDEEKFFRAVHEDRLEVSTWNGVKRVKFVMMRKDVIDSVLYSREVEVCELEDNHEVTYRYYKFKDILEGVDDLFLKLKKVHESMMEEGEFGPLLRASVESSMWFCSSGGLTSEWLRKGCRDGGMEQSGLLRVDLLLTEMFSRGEFDESKTIAIEYLKGLFINDFMMDARRSWLPPCGEGSQNSDFGPHRLLASITIEIADAIEEQFREDDEGD